MKNRMFFRAIIAFFVLVPLVGQAQSYLETFGQNRIQYRKFDWKYFDTRHFRVYHYDRQGRQLGRYVAEEAENDIKVVERKLGGQFPHRFNIILYNSYDEYRQSNVGLKDEAQGLGNAKAGTVHLVGDKLVVYFTGQHADLRHQILSGMARVVMERMIFGDNFKKMVKNALLLNLPEWVTDGYIAYLVDGWDPESNRLWKSLLDAQPDKSFHAFSEDNPELAGKAFWKFVSNQYSPVAVKNLLYSMQQKASPNKAMKQPDALNMKITRAYDSCINYYKAVYAADAQRQQQPDSTRGILSLKVPKDNSVLRNIRVSPRGTDVGYVAWKDGMYTVCSEKVAGHDVATLLEGGQKDYTEQTDPNYPMLAWSATGNKLAILYKKGSKVKMRIYNSQRGRIEDYVIPKNRFDRVLGMAFAEDDDKMILSAIRKSQTDLFMFTFKGSKLTNITDDEWDDVSPGLISGGSRKGIVFLSNRPKPNMHVEKGVNELPTGPMNAYFYNTRTQSPELLQLTNVKEGTISQPIAYGNDNFAYLYDGNGITNKYVVMFARNGQNRDSAYVVPVTNYATGILSHQYNPASGHVADVIQDKDEYKVYFHDLKFPDTDKPVIKLEPSTLSFEKEDMPPVSVMGATGKLPAMHQKTEDTTAAVANRKPDGLQIKGGNIFRSEFTDTAWQPRRKSHTNRIGNADAADAASDSFMLAEINDSAYVKMKPAPYRLSFKPDMFSVKLDNSVLFSQYQSIATNHGQYNNPSLSALTTIGFDELMEDYKITAGFQIPINVTSSTYFLQYQNYRHRLDWGLLALHSQARDYIGVIYPQLSAMKSQLFKTVSNLAQADFNWPLDRVRSVRFHTSVRQDKFTQKTTDTLSLAYDFPRSDFYTSMSRLEYVFDNTITPALNILNGMRFKVYTEYMRDIGSTNKSCVNVGIDARNYQKLYKNIILANRLAYAHSGGTAQVEYLLGGVDNWVFPRQDPNAGIQAGDNFAFQYMATSLRGYDQYARMGNNYAVLSTEVRIPVITTFFKRPIQSTVLKNLQLVPFVDAGSAWYGFLPNTQAMYIQGFYAQSPPYNTNVFLQIGSYNGGFALGYGTGLRTSLFGYFMRLDAAWSIDGSKRPSFYFGLGTDF